MGFPGADVSAIHNFRPRYAGIRELNIGDAWRATWVGDEEIPADAPMLHGYVVVVSEDKGYVSRRSGQNTWGVAEGAVAAAESPEEFAKRAAAEQAGAAAGNAHLIGFFECRATSHNPDFPVGSATIRPLYLFVATKLKDLGAASNFERRRLPLNEFAKVLRDSYPEFTDSMVKVVDRYFVLRANGTA